MAKKTNEPDPILEEGQVDTAAPVDTGAKVQSIIAKGSRTVTVACKLPNGLIMQLHKWVPHEEDVFGGGKKITRRSEAVGEPITLNGNAVGHGENPDHQIVGGYGLTHGVPSEFFAQFLEEQKDSLFIKNGLVFAMSQVSSAEAAAKENRTLKSGLEPLDRKNLPRLSRRHRVESATNTDSAAA